MDDTMKVQQVVDKLQSAVQALVTAQNNFIDQDPDRKVDVTYLRKMLIEIDEDAWAIADEVELAEMS